MKKRTGRIFRDLSGEGFEYRDGIDLKRIRKKLKENKIRRDGFEENNE